MNDVMIDFETLSTTPDATVISLGAVFFNPKTDQISNVTFYMAFEIQEQLDKGRAIDASTLKWWFSQSDAAKKVFNEKAKPVKEVLETFVWWVKTNSPNLKKVKIWGNGATFDVSIIENLLLMYDITPPWMFSNVRDVRTFREYIGLDAPIEKIGTAHNALDDARSQASYICKKYRIMKDAMDYLASQGK